MKLRPYQQESYEGVFSEWRKGRKRTLLVLPTGTGKTIVFSKIAEESVRNGDRVLILAHRGELLNQAADKIEQSTGLTCAVEKAEETSIGSWSRIVVGSVQSMVQEKRLSRFKPDHFDVIIIDEAHHALSNTYKTVLNHFKDAKVLGVTATPDRGDMQNLGQLFESLAYEYSLPKAIKDGFLSPIKALTLPINIDVSSVRQSQGDFSMSGLGTALDPYLEEIAKQMWEQAKDRKIVVFLPLIKTSQKFTELLNEVGFKAAEVNGQSKDRDQILEDFENDKYNVICNSMLLNEGWDSPAVDCVVVLRATKVRSLYSQMIGRGTRLSPDTGKEDLLLLDFLWHSENHELVHPAHLIAEDKAVAKKATEMIEQSDEPIDITEIQEEAADEVTQEREDKLAEQLEANRRRKKRLVDPLQFAYQIADEDLKNYVPLFGQEVEPVTEKQKIEIEKAGINPTALKTQGEAQKLIDKLHERQTQGLSTPKQIRQLEQRGYRNVEKWTFNQSKKLIARIAANRWRTPHPSPGTYQPEPDNADLF